MFARHKLLGYSESGSRVTCRVSSDHSILEGFPTVEVFPIQPTKVFWRHVAQA